MEVKIAEYGVLQNKSDKTIDFLVSNVYSPFEEYNVVRDEEVESPTMKFFIGDFDPYISISVVRDEEVESPSLEFDYYYPSPEDDMVKFKVRASLEDVSPIEIEPLERIYIKGYCTVTHNGSIDDLIFIQNIRRRRV